MCPYIYNLQDQAKKQLSVIEKRVEEYEEYLLKIKMLHKRMMSGEDIDVIFYFLFDSLRCLQDEIKQKN